MRNRSLWMLVAFGLVAGQFAHAQTQDQEYILYNNLSADSGVNDAGVACTPTTTDLSNRCYSGSRAFTIASGSSGTRVCVGESIAFWGEGTDSVARTWSCGDSGDQRINVGGTASACGRGMITYGVQCVNDD